MKQVRVWPPFYARLSFECTIDQELEIVGRRLSEIESTFAEAWDECMDVPGRDHHWRAVIVVLDGGALATIYARESPDDPDVIQIRAISVTPPP